MNIDTLEKAVEELANTCFDSPEEADAYNTVRDAAKAHLESLKKEGDVQVSQPDLTSPEPVTAAGRGTFEDQCGFCFVRYGQHAPACDRNNFTPPIPQKGEVIETIMTPEQFNKLNPNEQQEQRIISWLQEARDATDGKYGRTPQGESMDFWRGRRAVLAELAAFIM